MGPAWAPMRKKKDGILRYFQQVADGVHSIVGEGDAPLVLAGVEYLLPIYRHAAEYPHIVESEITRNPEDLSHRHLHRRPSPPVQPLFRKERAHIRTAIMR